MTTSIKLFLRNIKRNKLISFISIGGFAISMSVILIIVTFIINEWSVNRSYENFDRIHRIRMEDGFALIPHRLLPELRKDIPGVDKACMYSITNAYYKNGNEMQVGRFISTEDEYFDIFSHDFIFKDADPTINSVGNIILTQKFSEELFGQMNPVGKVIEFQDSDKKIVGVIKDIPEKSSFKFDAVVNLESGFSSSSWGIDDEEYELYSAFISTKPNSDVIEVQKNIAGLMDKWEGFDGIQLIAQPFEEVYFDKIAEEDDLERANKDFIVMLWWVAVAILVMAIFNYVNITVARGKERLAEIGIRKTIGADKKVIFKQFLQESLFVSFLSVIAALCIAIIVAPLFSKALSTEIDIFSVLTHSNIIQIILLVFLIVGLLAGFYPALVAAYFSPKQAISGTSKVKKSNFRSSIIAAQFLVTGFLFISLIVVNKQINFVKNKDLGYDKDQLVRVVLSGNSRNSSETFKATLLTNPNIKSATITMGTPLDIHSESNGTVDVNGEEIQVEDTDVIAADKDFVKTFGLNIVEGRDFRNTDKDVALINQHLFKFLGWENLENKTLFDLKVVGVIEDFHHNNLYTQIGNFLLTYSIDDPSSISLLMDGNVSENVEFIKEKFAEIEPNIPCHLRFYDDWVDRQYKKEEARAYAIKLFAIIAILISCLGLIGLVEHFTTQRIKEIGIRKVNGAKVSEIVALLNKDFVIWIIIAFAMACPLAYYFMNKWLQTFAYKTTIDWWIYVVAGISALAIALLTVSWQTIKVASRNPVESLRYE